MPRKSLCLKTIELMRERISKLRKEYIERELLDEEDSIEDDKYLHYLTVLNQMVRKRYMYRKSYYRTNRKKFDLDDALSYDSENYNDEEFLLHFRMSRQSFFLLLEQISETKEFSKKPKKEKTSSDFIPTVCFLI